MAPYRPKARKEEGSVRTTARIKIPAAAVLAAGERAQGLETLME